MATRSPICSCKHWPIVGLLRAEDVAADGASPSSDNVNLFFSALGGLLGGDAGSGSLTMRRRIWRPPKRCSTDLIERLRGYFGHTEDVTGGGSVPALEEYDLGLPNPTSFVAFELRAGPPSRFDGGDVADQIVFNWMDLGEQAGDSVTITGPTGVGIENFVPFETPLPYSVTATYDNESSEAVREIRILVPLDDTIDERSFQLAGITLGSRSISLPPGRPNFVGEFDLTDVEGYQLQVTAGVDANTRIASYFLRAIDPRDGLPPVDAAIGLLQPGQSVKVGFFASVNDTNAAGQTSDPQTGDAIEMTARVIVDGNAPVD